MVEIACVSVAHAGLALPSVMHSSLTCHHGMGWRGLNTTEGLRLPGPCE